MNHNLFLEIAIKLTYLEMEMNWMALNQERERLQKFVVTVKYLQFIFLAVLFYGLAMLSYDLLKMIPAVPISAWSIGCSVFGAEGVIASVLIIRSTEKKIDKLLQTESSSK